MVVEDDPLVRAYVREVLEGAGYRVLEAATGTEAIDLFESSRDRVTAVVLDLTLPRLTGLEVAARLRSMSPDLPILLTSGHTDPRPAADRAASRTLFLQKPFLPDQMINRLRQLSGPASPLV